MIKQKEQTRPWLNIFEQIWHHCVLFPKVKQQSTFALLARRDQQDQASVVFTLLALSGSCRQSVQFLHLKTLLSQFSSSESAGYYLQVKGLKRSCWVAGLLPGAGYCREKKSARQTESTASRDVLEEVEGEEEEVPQHSSGQPVGEGGGEGRAENKHLKFGP